MGDPKTFPLNDYPGNTTTGQNDHSGTTGKKQKQKKFKKLKRKYQKNKKTLKKIKARSKAERNLYTERERRYQAEADLKCAVFLLNVMAQGRQIPLPDLSQGGGGGDNP